MKTKLTAPVRLADRVRRWARQPTNITKGWTLAGWGLMVVASFGGIAGNYRYTQAERREAADDLVEACQERNQISRALRDYADRLNARIDALFVQIGVSDVVRLRFDVSAATTLPPASVTDEDCNGDRHVDAADYLN
jgi:hypothetical protein